MGGGGINSGQGGGQGRKDVKSLRPQNHEDAPSNTTNIQQITSLKALPNSTSWQFPFLCLLCLPPKAVAGTSSTENLSPPPRPTSQMQDTHKLSLNLWTVVFQGEVFNVSQQMLYLSPQKNPETSPNSKVCWL